MVAYKRRYRKRRPMRRRRRRRTTRRRRRKLGLGSVRRMPTSMPDSILVKLKYQDSVSMTNETGYGSYTWSMNSINDPDVTATGHQPYAHDEWANFYSKYICYGSKIRITTRMSTSGNISNVNVLYPGYSTSAALDVDAASEYPYATRKNLSVARDLSQANYHSKYDTVARTYGQLLTGVNFSADMGSNPNVQTYWHYVLQADITSDDISNFILDVTLVYYCRLFRKVILSQS